MDDIYSITNDESKDYLKREGCLDFLKYGFDEELSPEWDDLARLFFLVRQRKPFQILEFGSGFSTIIMAYALKRNWDDYLDSFSEDEAEDLNPSFDKPKLVAVESLKKWEKNSISKLKDVQLDSFAEIAFSEVEIAEYNGQICHFYKNLPDVVPDFVYLDGPDPATVEGNINGLSFKNPLRTVMSADILKYESTLIPGFFMIVDGRTNNCRFLENNLKRDYKVKDHKKADVTTFELTEDRLGRKNVYGWEAYNNKQVHYAGKKVN